MKKPYFPMFVDISGKRIVVIGGGKIAQRRIETLLIFADDILVISPVITETIREFYVEKRIRWMETTYQEELLRDADIVLAATDDPGCNERIIKDCHKRGIPANAAHKKELCDFYFPAVVKKENVVVGVTTSGFSHREARQARREIERALYQLPENPEGAADDESCRLPENQGEAAGNNFSRLPENPEEGASDGASRLPENPEEGASDGFCRWKDKNRGNIHEEDD